MIILDVCLLFIFLALCLTVGAVPVDQDHQGQDKQAVGYHDRVQNGCQRLCPVNGIRCIPFLVINILHKFL